MKIEQGSTKTELNISDWQAADINAEFDKQFTSAQKLQLLNNRSSKMTKAYMIL